jgi:hypothetical protein
MSRIFDPIVLGIVLLVGGLPIASLHAYDRPYPSQLEMTFEWRYSCPTGRGCSFNCARMAGASNVTKLAIHLGAIPLGGTQNTVGIFYEFSSVDIPRGNGFDISTGISTLSCQVQGMNLDYSGPTETRTGSLPEAK